jgi:uncharacterized small protein (DUF1192 family)
MTNTEIFTRVSTACEELEELLSDMDVFTFNPRVAELEKEIEDLQAQCKHSFHDGSCEYCGKEEE